MPEILIVDDEPSILTTVSLLLRTEGYLTHTATCLKEAHRILKCERVDLLLTDLKLKEGNGATLINYLDAMNSTTECIVMTAYGSLESAVDCMRRGAVDYLTKPVDPMELLRRVRPALDRKKLNDRVQGKREEGASDREVRDLIYKSPQIASIVSIIKRIREQEMTILITGETGTGKEVVAHAIHKSSVRASGPFVAINCCTLPEDLLDSELFGHAKGSFTGATAETRGLFKQAHGGTLFLDEIGDISPRLQSKLLRALQEGEVRPVGSDRYVSVDVRIIAATNRDLPALISKGEFRLDLFYRLNVMPIHIPPLRERPMDVAAIAEHILCNMARRFGRDPVSLTAAAWSKLTLYDYPGNVRQLENVLERSVALSQASVIDVDDIYFDFVQKGVGAPSQAAVETALMPLELERASLQHIQRVLALHHGNQVGAAKALGISRSTLRRKLGLT